MSEKDKPAGYHWPDEYGHWCGTNNAPAAKNEKIAGKIGEKQWTDAWLKENGLPLPQDSVDRACMVHDLQLAAIRNTKGDKITFTSPDPEVIKAHEQLASNFARAALTTPSVVAKAYALGGSAAMSSMVKLLSDVVAGKAALEKTGKAIKAAQKALKSFGRQVSSKVQCAYQSPRGLDLAAGRAGKVKALYLEAKDGKAEVGLLKGSSTSHRGWLGSSLESRIGYVSGVAKDGRLGGEVGVAKVAGSVFVGPDPNNPFGEARGELKAFSAEAKGDFLVGGAGRRVGLGLGGKLKVTPVSAKVSGETNIPLPFTDWTLAVRGSARGSAEGVLEGHAYYDKQEERAHVGGTGGILGILGLDISMGKPYTTRSRETDF